MSERTPDRDMRAPAAGIASAGPPASAGGAVAPAPPAAAGLVPGGPYPPPSAAEVGCWPVRRLVGSELAQAWREAGP